MKNRALKQRKRVSLMAIIEATTELINSIDFLNMSRKKANYFTRKRKMPFNKLVIFILNLVKSSTQTCLDSFFDMVGQSENHMAQQSFSEARDKIKWEAFQDMHKMTVNLIYSGFYKTWHGYRVLAIDGTKVQLPSDGRLRQYFGTAGEGKTSVTSQASTLYDVYNNVIIDARLESMKIGERKLAELHINELCKLSSFDKECIIFDRGYASFELIETMISRNISYVMRVKSKFNTQIDHLSEGDHFLVFHKKDHADISVRVLKFPLPSGNLETIITNINDKRMGVKAFKELYFKRWPIETKYDEIKNKLEV